MRKIFFIFLFVFLIVKICTANLIVSPEQIDFELMQKETSCKNLSLEGKGIILVKDKWAEKWETRKEFNLHKLNSNEVKIELDYPKNISIDKKEKIEICLTPEEFGKYHGLLLFREENSKSGIGIWLNVSVKRNEFLNQITGAFVDSKNEKLDLSRGILIFSFVLLILLSAILIILIRKTKI